MQSLNDVIVTDIAPPFVVHSEKATRFQMEDRASYGLSLCISGQIAYSMNGKTHISNQTNAVLLPRGGYYSILGQKEGLFPLINFQCDNLNCPDIIVYPLDDPQNCIKQFENLKSLFLNNNSRLEIMSAFYTLLAEISSDHSNKHNPLHFVIQYIQENVANTGLSNEILAAEMGISEIYLRKLFTAHLKTTPKQYVLEVRIRKAKQMLADTSFTVTKIAEECGFSSLYHFCRAFKIKTGMTPTEYAQQNKIYQI